MHTAPADHRELIERLTTGHAGTTEVHDHLIAAVNAQQERRDWIVANWPHVVELEQLNATDRRPTRSRPLADSGTSSSPGRTRRHGLYRFSRHHRVSNAHWPRSTRKRPPTTPFDRPKQRSTTSTNLPSVSRRAPSGRPSTTHYVRHDSSFDKLAESNTSTTSSPDTAAAPTTTPCERRRLTVGYDVLTDPPDWVVEHLRRLHDDGRLGATRVDDLATRIVDAAVHLDRHGYLPDGWAEFGLRPATRPVPVIEIEVPGP